MTRAVREGRLACCLPDLADVDFDAVERLVYAYLTLRNEQRSAATLSVVRAANACGNASIAYPSRRPTPEQAVTSLTARNLVEAGLAEIRDATPIVRAQDWPGIGDVE